MSSIEIRPLRASELKAAEDLSQEVFGFSDRNVVPAWEMLFVTRCGGLAIGAFENDRLVGFSYAFPALEDGRPFLYSNGLSVRPERRSLGIGLRLKLAQREHAIELGYDRIRWTANPLNAPIMYLSLTKLGASLVGYHPGLVRELIPELALDDVTIDWVLDRPPPADDVRAGELVEIPWDWRSVRDAGGDALERWRSRVATAMQALLAAGYRGDRVIVDRGARRSFVRFTAQRADVAARSASSATSSVRATSADV